RAMYIEQSPKPGRMYEPDSPERAPESGEPSERYSVSRDPDVGTVSGDDEALAPESGSRSDLSGYPAGRGVWKSSDWEASKLETSQHRARSPWLPAALGAGGVVLAVGVAAAVLSTRRRYEFRDKTVLITGGSRGLGLVLARQFAREGARLVLLARDEDELARAKDELCALGAQVLTI